MRGTLAVLWVVFVIGGTIAGMIWGSWHYWLIAAALAFIAWQVIWPGVKTPYDD